MAVVEQLIRWKTNAWKDSRMVGLYSHRMADRFGANRLYHLIEPKLCEAFTIGRRVLDVGVGTGRASLPLARKGLNVTGVDSSHAMLKECRRLAGEAPITLLTGDLCDLPVRDSSFDTIMALHVLVHFPHWRQALKEWTRKLCPDGRIIFDLHSLDHLEYIQNRRITGDELIQSHAVQEFAMHVGVEDIAAAADELGLSITAIIPYSFLNASSRYQSPFDYRPLNDAYWWRRYATWMGGDDKLFDFCLFFEEEFLFRLSSVVTGRFMVVLDKRPGKDTNCGWLKRNRRLNDILLTNCTLDALSSYLPAPLDDWKQTLNRHLDYSRNRQMFYFFWTRFWKNPKTFQLSSFLEERHVRSLEQWWARETLDLVTSAIAQNWFRSPEIADILTVQDVNLGIGMEYDLTRNLLEKYFYAFGENTL